MPFLPQVIDTFAQVGGYDRGTWFVFARKLREAGDLSPSQRGLRASPITATDAAKILIAGMATDSPARASERLGHFWPLPLQARSNLPVFAVLDGCPLATFGEAVAAMITNAIPIGRSLMVRATARRPRPADANALRGAFEAGITVDRSAGIARVTLGELRRDKMMTGSLTWAAEPGSRATPAWSSATTVSWPALVELSLAISGDE